MRLLFIGLLCAGLALGCGGSNKPPEGSTDSAANAGPQDGNQSPGNVGKNKKPPLTPPEAPPIKLP